MGTMSKNGSKEICFQKWSFACRVIDHFSFHPILFSQYHAIKCSIQYCTTCFPVRSFAGQFWRNITKSCFLYLFWIGKYQKTISVYSGVNSIKRQLRVVHITGLFPPGVRLGGNKKFPKLYAISLLPWIQCGCSTWGCDPMMTCTPRDTRCLVIWSW